MQSIVLRKEVEEEIIKQIKSFSLTDRDEEISDFKASLYLDFILKEIGPYIYNQAVDDAYQLMLKKLEDLYGLEKHAR